MGFRDAMEYAVAMHAAFDFIYVEFAVIPSTAFPGSPPPPPVRFPAIVGWLCRMSDFSEII